MIRPATHADIDTLVGFTLRKAREAEGLDQAAADVEHGVRAAVADPPRATYWVAQGWSQPHVVVSRYRKVGIDVQGEVLARRRIG